MIKALKKDWFIEDNIDVEYQYYIFKDFIKKIETEVDQNKIFPAINILTEELKNLNYVKRNMKKFKKEVTSRKVIVEGGTMKYKIEAPDDNLSSYLEEIFQFTIPDIEDLLSYAEDKFRGYLNGIVIKKTGIIPIDFERGFAVINLNNSLYKIIQFHYIKGIYDAKEKQIGINIKEVFSGEDVDECTQYIKDEKTKNDYVVYMSSEHSQPYQETILPAIKRKIMKHLTSPTP